MGLFSPEWTLTFASLSAGHGNIVVAEVTRLAKMAVSSSRIVSTVDADTSTAASAHLVYFRVESASLGVHIAVAC